MTGAWIAWTFAAGATGMALGVLSPELRGLLRRRPRVDESVAATAEVVHPITPPPQPPTERQLPDVEVAQTIAVAVEPVQEVMFDAPHDVPAVEKILTKPQRRSKRNGGRRRRRKHGRR